MQDDWTHLFHWRELNTAYFLWFELSVCVLLLFVSLYFCFALFLEAQNRPLVITGPASTNQSKHHMIKFFLTYFCIIPESLYPSGLAKCKSAGYNFSFITQHTSTTEAQVCVKNYNSDANNKDVVTVDYMVTGGRRSETIIPKITYLWDLTIGGNFKELSDPFLTR